VIAQADSSPQRLAAWPNNRRLGAGEGPEGWRQATNRSGQMHRRATRSRLAADHGLGCKLQRFGNMPWPGRPSLELSFSDLSALWPGGSEPAAPSSANDQTMQRKPPRAMRHHVCRSWRGDAVLLARRVHADALVILHTERTAKSSCWASRIDVGGQLAAALSRVEKLAMPNGLKQTHDELCNAAQEAWSTDPSTVCSRAC
jgi:hypothetical protein